MTTCQGQVKFHNPSQREVFAPVKLVTSDNATTYANGVTLGQLDRH